jgi:hypothetical protein
VGARGAQLLDEFRRHPPQSKRNCLSI